WGSNRIDCFARGTNRALFHQAWNGVNWSGWGSLGGELLEQPSCTSWGSNRLDCFARGNDSALYQQWWPCPQCAIVNKALAVSRFTTASITNAEADQILGNATNVLQANNGNGDVACQVSMSRSGNVSTFATGDGSIDSSAEFNAVISTPGVKVVNRINWCGSLAPNIIGCAPVPGSAFTVVRYSSGITEGILWAHEYGHTRGLNHRNDATAVMNGTIASTHLNVTATECNAFRN
ncbi:MAG: hypothetical protein K0Q67_2480, partial [Cellvibrio sp.]|nr:hypothetical protein [Cellvibrio sp.]